MHLRHLTVISAVLSVLALTGCSSDDPAFSLDGARRAADKQNPTTCPLHLDAPAALSSAGVRTTLTPDSVIVQKSQTDKPADDPIGAQKGGMSAIEATAGVYVDCTYKATAGELDVQVTVTPGKAAAGLLAPELVKSAQLSMADAQPLLASPPGPGEVKIVSGKVAFGGIAVDGGDGAILVTSELPDLRDDMLATVTKTVIGQLRN